MRKRGRLVYIKRRSYTTELNRAEKLPKKTAFANIMPSRFQPQFVEENGSYRYKHHTYVFQEAALSFADRVNYKTTYYFVAKTGFLFFDSFVLHVANMANILRNAAKQEDYIDENGDYLEGIEIINQAALKRFHYIVKATAKLLFQMYRFSKNIRLKVKEFKGKKIVFHDMPMPSAFEYHCFNEYALQKEKPYENVRAEERTNQRLFHVTMREQFFMSKKYHDAMDSYLDMRATENQEYSNRFHKEYFSTSSQAITEDDLAIDDEEEGDEFENE